MNIGDVLDALTAVMAADRLIFVPTALVWLRWLLFFMIVWTSFSMVFEGFDHWRLIRLFILYLAIWTVLNNWTSAVQVVTGEVHFLRQMVEHGQESLVFEKVTKITGDVASAKPLLPSPGDWVVIWILEIVLAAFEAAIYFVLTYGYIASAMCEIVGPLLLALCMIPAMAWIAWGWFRSFVGYALYPLFGAIYCDIVARILTFFMNEHPAPWSIADLSVMLAGFVMLVVGLVVGIWKLPRLVGDILGGAVGSSAALTFRVMRSWT